MGLISFLCYLLLCYLVPNLQQLPHFLYHFFPESTLYVYEVFRKKITNARL